MMTWYLLCPAAAICLALSPASGQTPSEGAPSGALYPVNTCDDPKVPIGVLPKGFGTVSYRLAKDGKPDTASIVVLKAFGLSVAGFRSVAVRALSACRFEMGKLELRAPAVVVEEIHFADSTAIDLGLATASPAPGPPLAVETLGLPQDSFPMPIADRRIEERPRRLSCKPPQSLPFRVSASGTSRADVQTQAQTQLRIAHDQWNQVNAGTLVGQLRVGADGKPGNQVKVIEVSNSVAAQNLAELIGGCRFVPGRYRGILVPAMVETTIGVAPISGP
jgi:hypothetical protein